MFPWSNPTEKEKSLPPPSNLSASFYSNWANLGPMPAWRPTTICQPESRRMPRTNWLIRTIWGKNRCTSDRTNKRLWRTKSPIPRTEAKDYTISTYHYYILLFLFAVTPKDVTCKYSIFLLDVWLYFFLLTLASLQVNHLLLQTCLCWVSI